jgi:hypothetical protein
MPTKAMYLIRNARGHMRTVIAQSHRGAIREYLSAYPTAPGEDLEVKQRGAGADDWQAFRVS